MMMKMYVVLGLFMRCESVYALFSHSRGSELAASRPMRLMRLDSRRRLLGYAELADVGENKWSRLVTYCPHHIEMRSLDPGLLSKADGTGEMIIISVIVLAKCGITRGRRRKTDRSKMQVASRRKRRRCRGGSEDHPAGRTPAIEGGKGDGKAIGEGRTGGAGIVVFKEP